MLKKALWVVGCKISSSFSFSFTILSFSLRIIVWLFLHFSRSVWLPQAKKAKRLAKATKTVKSQLSAVPLPDVDRCTHLTTRSVLYHAVWSGEMEKLRNGVLTHSQAWSIVAVALLLPCLGGGGTSKLRRPRLGTDLECRTELIRVLFSQCWSCFQWLKWSHRVSGVPMRWHVFLQLY